MAVLPAFGHARRNTGWWLWCRTIPSNAGSSAGSTASSSSTRMSSTQTASRAVKSTRSTSRCPNHLHRDYAVRAARGGSPRPLREAHGRDRGRLRGDDRAPRTLGNVRLMIAYRLHFEEANLEARRDREFRKARGAAHLRLGLHDAGRGPGQHPPEPDRPGRRTALRHRHLLHQRGALPLPRRTDGGRRVDAPTTAKSGSATSTR